MWNGFNLVAGDLPKFYISPGLLGDNRTASVLCFSSESIAMPHSISLRSNNKLLHEKLFHTEKAGDNGIGPYRA